MNSALDLPIMGIPIYRSGSTGQRGHAMTAHVNHSAEAMLGKIGFTPSDRSKIKVAPKDAAKNPFDNL